MSFLDLRKDVLQNALLSTNYFAEEATFSPMDGPARTVRCHVRYRAAEPDDRGTREKREVIEVLVSRDPASEQTGGIDRLRTGDLLLRTADRDSDRRPWTFTGEVLDESVVKWRLVFSRVRRVVQGRGL